MSLCLRFPSTSNDPGQGIVSGGLRLPSTSNDPGQGIVSGHSVAKCIFFGLPICQKFATRFWRRSNIFTKIVQILLSLADPQAAPETALGATPWVCLVESDVYFSVPNFRRFLARHADAAQRESALFVGKVYFYNFASDHFYVEPALAGCLNNAAVRRLADFFRGVLADHPTGVPRFTGGCEYWREDVHEQLVPVFSYCLVEAGVRLFDPTQLHDARGRPYWVMS